MVTQPIEQLPGFNDFRGLAVMKDSHPDLRDLAVFVDANAGQHAVGCIQFFTGFECTIHFLSFLVLTGIALIRW